MRQKSSKLHPFESGNVRGRSCELSLRLEKPAPAKRRNKEKGDTFASSETKTSAARGTQVSCG